jgi:hypothetical protein
MVGPTGCGTGNADTREIEIAQKAARCRRPKFPKEKLERPAQALKRTEASHRTTRMTGRPAKTVGADGLANRIRRMCGRRRQLLRLDLRPIRVIRGSATARIQHRVDLVGARGFALSLRSRCEHACVERPVDHLAPLQSKLVCRLHCEANLQVRTGAESCTKNDLRWSDAPQEAAQFCDCGAD